MRRSRDSEQEYEYTHEANTEPGAQQKTEDECPFTSTKVFPVLQSATAEDILYRRMDVSACRKKGAHILRGIGKAHVL